jgi:hypothetical protein
MAGIKPAPQFPHADQTVCKRVLSANGAYSFQPGATPWERGIQSLHCMVREGGGPPPLLRDRAGVIYFCSRRIFFNAVRFPRWFAPAILSVATHLSARLFLL